MADPYFLLNIRMPSVAEKEEFKKVLESVV